MSRRPVPCVAINENGDVAMAFESLKGAASFMDLLPDRVRKAIVEEKIVSGYRWMYTEDYEALTKKERKSLFPQKRKRRKATKEEKNAIQSKRRDTNATNAFYRKQQFAKAFADFAKHHIPWMHELKDKWLEQFDIGIRPELLADYYEEKQDKEIALLASLLITTGDKCYQRVQQYRDILGDHPWEWFKSREFANRQDVWVGERYRIFKFFHEWWVECFKYGTYDSIEDCVMDHTDDGALSCYEVLMRLVESYGWKIPKIRIAHLLLVLSHSDGLGEGLWGISREDVDIPVTMALNAFLRTWMPDAPRYGKPDECAGLFGMDSVDFYYCYLAYEELKRFRPDECGKYASFYYKTYMRHSHNDPSVWRNKQPKIIFSPESEDFL